MKVNDWATNLFKIIGAALILSIAFNYFSPNGIPLFGFKSELEVISDSVLFSQSTSDSFITDITIQQAVKLIETRNIVLIDARSETEYSNFHLLGAINIPSKTFDQHSEKILNHKLDTTLIIYCESIHCNQSYELAKLLAQFGFNKIFVMKEGIQEWIERDLPFTK
ncbi:MAG: rhodanese-like domain-containing protein [Ignavibacteria bacterium]|nr:rhodanese-like domain-containing protein [Ignavibacteria bacterium]